MPERNTDFRWLEILDAILEQNLIKLIVIPDFYNPDIHINVRFIDSEADTNNSLRFFYNSLSAVIIGDSSGHVSVSKFFPGTTSISIIPENIDSGNGPQTGSHLDLKRIFNVSNIYHSQPLKPFSFYYSPRSSPDDFFKFAIGLLSD